MKLLWFVIFILFIVSCNTEPHPLIIGKDKCSFCKMPVADPKFGAEIITIKGKLYKFDDIICMISFFKRGLEDKEKVKNTLVVDYYDSQKLIDVNNSFFLKSDSIHTPMNGGIAAFDSPAK